MPKFSSELTATFICAFQCVLLLIRTFHTMIRYAIHLYDVAQTAQWERKGELRGLSGSSLPGIAERAWGDRAMMWPRGTRSAPVTSTSILGSCSDFRVTYSVSLGKD